MKQDPRRSFPVTFSFENVRVETGIILDLLKRSMILFKMYTSCMVTSVTLHVCIWAGHAFLCHLDYSTKLLDTEPLLLFS